MRPGKSDTGQVALEPKATKLTGAAFSYPVGTNLAVPAPKISIAVGKKDDGDIQITNADTATVFFTATEVATNIPSADFSNPATDVADDYFVTTPEPDFSLAPGAEEDFLLGPDLGDNYASVVFTASFDPTFTTNTVTLGFAGDIELPEPNFLGLAFVGGVLALGFRRWAVVTVRT